MDCHKKSHQPPAFFAHPNQPSNRTNCGRRLESPRNKAAMKWETTVSQWNLSRNPGIRLKNDKHDGHVAMLVTLHFVAWHHQQPSFLDHACNATNDCRSAFRRKRACMDNRACVSRFEKGRFDRRDSSHPSIRPTCESGFMIDDV